ncbi:prophenoloxidase beta [Penaeus vannamei]|uniref:Prophenoloxidase beta n=1 Tax=Penaeus vannamei TaxID=6689 RepID=A0A3R7PGQ6_PENVA|nr:prophenoloxidase beta [Penaeus vannamei]
MKRLFHLPYENTLTLDRQVILDMSAVEVDAADGKYTARISTEERESLGAASPCPGESPSPSTTNITPRQLRISLRCSSMQRILRSFAESPLLFETMSTKRCSYSHSPMLSTRGMSVWSYLFRVCVVGTRGLI